VVRGSRPRFGQHFLKSPRTIARIVAALGAGEGATVVEVGPGRGALTRELLDSGLRVLAFEIDVPLAERLRAELAERSLFLKVCDALEADVGSALAEIDASPPVPLVGNLPYESATPMLRAFVRRPDLYSRIVAMVQKEVADRLIAPPDGDAYGYLTLDVGAHAKARRLFDVPRGEFEPPPEVTSTVVELTPHPAADGAAGALKVASAAFKVRRKTLVNGLTPLWGRERAQRAVAEAGFPPTVRAETLGLDAFLALVPLLGPPGRTDEP
jgi:16S rRNA (adenine1518-N6/adenine1519-N6)-dimethyltransferase